MRWKRALAGALLLAAIADPAGAREERREKGAVGHDLIVRLDTSAHRIAVRDRIDLHGAVAADAGGAYRFVLHAGLDPRVMSAGWTLKQEPGEVTATFAGINATTDSVAENVPLEGWRLSPNPRSGSKAGPPGGVDVAAIPAPIEIEYSGVIHHPIAVEGEEYQRGFSETPGTIEVRGVFLSGTSFWVPTFGDGLVTFDLEVRDLTPPWDAVSQGERVLHETEAGGARTTRWSCPHPTEEIYLVAGPWHEYAARSEKIDLFAFLRTEDPSLASKYLGADQRYLRMYEGILPAYPYASFSLVENFWETGYGMPGFTLLGEKIIRFPFIITSSYPHELLHNWWGNSVYVDPSQGNWCEGLTAYMADHMFEEQRGQGATYRRTTLQKYADFVREGKDFSLASFRTRRSAASEAVGYGKSLMIFHMVRRQVGDAAFLEALSSFAGAHRFTRAGYADLADAFSAAAGTDWRPFFRTWIGRTGAPRIAIAEAKALRAGADGAAWQVQVRLRQVQHEDPFPLSVPVAVTVGGGGETIASEVRMDGREAAKTIACPSRPLRLDVDPAFDLMRRLDPLEVPPALSTLFGEEDPVFVLPSGAAPAELDAWRALAAAWKHEGAPRIMMDAHLQKLPDGAVWVLGWDNLLRDRVARSLSDQGVALTPDGAMVGSETIARTGRSIVLVSRRATDARAAAGWIGADPVAAIPGLARKLPHYTKYSYLVFRGDEPENTGKGMWQPTSSPLVRNLGDGPLPPLRIAERRPLADLPAAFDADALKRSVEALASEEMRGRGIGTDGLERAAAWVETRFRELGLEPAGETGFRYPWTWKGEDPSTEIRLTNLAARIPGADPNLADHPVLVTAHLDHLGEGAAAGAGAPSARARAGNEGKIHPGADDNASGVAVLLDLARVLAGDSRSARPIVFAAVTGEESGLLGSRRLLGALAPEKLPFACLNLDTVGRLKDGKLYVLNADSAREWRFIFMGVEATTGTPISIVPEPLDSSDQVACLERGVPAVQLFTGPNADYHRPSDTAEKIDPEGMAKVAEAAYEAIIYLAGRAEPLASKLPAPGGSSAPPASVPPSTAPRRAALGTVPDFSFAGPGVRVQEVLPGSPAAAAGIVSGDVIVSFGGAEVTDLKTYSDLLKGRIPGDVVEVGVRRGGETISLRVTLGER
jgi:peptidase M28-like protein/PDZ domain-containing protein/peptidase M1-like protein